MTRPLKTPLPDSIVSCVVSSVCLSDEHKSCYLKFWTMNNYSLILQYVCLLFEPHHWHRVCSDTVFIHIYLNQQWPQSYWIVDVVKWSCKNAKIFDINKMNALEVQFYSKFVSAVHILYLQSPDTRLSVSSYKIILRRAIKM